MYDTLDEVYHHFVVEKNRDAFPEETEHYERFFQRADMDLCDAKETLVNNAGLTGFREGLRLGLLLARELPL